VVVGLRAWHEVTGGREMRTGRLILGLPVAVGGLLVIGAVVIGTPPALLANELSNSILCASMGMLLVGLAAVIVFR
jgi:hypothetical protein